ncbi:hypothetical protein SDC9_94314 [bioreactor metagenome]|uniref:Uncharacterized protein n=1 Tax=bioreactor metagenome TaxID=1076179 RepID=A0A645A9T6_9ZZZZ
MPFIADDVVTEIPDGVTTLIVISVPSAAIAVMVIADDVVVIPLIADGVVMSIDLVDVSSEIDKLAKIAAAVVTSMSPPELPPPELLPPVLPPPVPGTSTTMSKALSIVTKASALEINLRGLKV